MSETDGSAVEVAVTVSVRAIFRIVVREPILLVSSFLFGVTETLIETAGSPLTTSAMR